MMGLPVTDNSCHAPLARPLPAAQPWLLLAVACSAILPFLPFLGLPPISDDYSQWFFARRYIAPDGWSGLWDDTLYRSRATSLILSRSIDALFGLSQPAHLLAGLATHALNALLLFQVASALGLPRTASLLSALCFATHSGHQEAIVWIASQHELLVFAFCAIATLCWIRWSRTGGARWGGAAAFSYLAALYSKESAVILLPLLAYLWWSTPRRPRPMLATLLALTLFSALYTLAIFQATATHLHLNDGTFSLHAKFWITLPVSLARLLWPAGWLALALLLRAGGPLAHSALGALLWMITALLPYSFLTYQTRVPSRHTYLAAAGLAILLGLALHHLAQSRPPQQAWLAPTLFALLLAGNLLNLWLRKLPQFERRAASTVHFLRFAKLHPGPIALGSAPFPLTAYQHAVSIVFGRPPESVQRRSSQPNAQATLYSEVVHP